MNRFHDVDTIHEVIFQALGAASICWIPDTGDLEFDSTEARHIGSEALERLGELGVEGVTWLCPGCWTRLPVSEGCLTCEGRDVPGLFRHPPIDPVTYKVSAADNAIMLGDMRHCDTPPPWNNPDCKAVMNDHGWMRDKSPGGITVCPPPNISAIDELCTALRLTAEYVGTDILPPTAGWSWYDTLRKYRPDMLLAP